MTAAYHRHDMSDSVWTLLEPNLPGQRGQWGDCAGQQKVYQWCILGHPDRRALAGFTSGLWQVGTIHQRFIRWRRNGIWERILEVLIQDPDYEWLMIDASHVKVHPHAAVRVGIRTCPVQKGAQQQNTFGRGCECMPVRILVTKGTRADCKEAVHLIEEYPLKRCWQTAAMTRMKLLLTLLPLGWKLSSLPRRTERRRGLTMSISIGFVIWSKMLS